MQTKFAVDGAQLRGLDQARVRDDHRVQWPLELFEPKRQKPVQHRKPRTQIVVLPDIRLQERRMVGEPIENLCGGEAVALKLAAEISGANFFGCHSLSCHGCPPTRTSSLAGHLPYKQAQKLKNVPKIKALAAIGNNC